MTRSPHSMYSSIRCPHDVRSRFTEWHTGGGRERAERASTARHQSSPAPPSRRPPAGRRSGSAPRALRRRRLPRLLGSSSRSCPPSRRPPGHRRARGAGDAVAIGSILSEPGWSLVRFTEQLATARRIPMQVPVEIAFHNMESSPWAEQEIRNRIRKLEKIYDRLISCRVRVDQRTKTGGGTIPPVVRIEMGIP